jgi:hypothetical protein
VRQNVLRARLDFVQQGRLVLLLRQPVLRQMRSLVLQ